MKSRAEVDLAVREVKLLRLPAHPDPPKNWDALIALHEIINHTNTDAKVLDAGAEKYSPLLPWLRLYGYRNLTGNNLLFDKRRPKKVGPIVYEYGDITETGYADASIDAISCMSVVEHGVDLRRYFAEMARILKPAGILVTSTDYFDEHIDTRGQKAFGVPIRIFTKNEMLEAFRIARSYGLELTGEVDLACSERAVTWKQFRLSYTFLVFSMVKTG